MVNVTKIKSIAKVKGIKIGYLCNQLGLENGYFSDVSRGKNTMSDERIYKIAEMLGTSYAYLTDQTDEPSPIQGEPIPKTDLQKMKDMASELLDKINDLQKLRVILAALQAGAEQDANLSALPPDGKDEESGGTR